MSKKSVGFEGRQDGSDDQNDEYNPFDPFYDRDEEDQYDGEFGADKKQPTIWKEEKYDDYDPTWEAEGMIDEATTNNAELKAEVEYLEQTLSRPYETSIQRSNRSYKTCYKRDDLRYKGTKRDRQALWASRNGWKTRRRHPLKLARKDQLAPSRIAKAMDEASEMAKTRLAKLRSLEPDVDMAIARLKNRLEQ